MKHTPSSAAFTLALAVVALAGGETPKSAQVDALLAPWAKNDSPGAAVMVIQNGKVAHQACYGIANLEAKVPIAPDTAFDLASVSKQFNSMAIMILAERGKLKFDDPLSKFFPQFPPYARKITVRHLLNHTSGLPDYMELFVKTGKIDKDGKPVGFEPTSRDVLELLAQQKELLFEPGTKWEYSNSGYVVLAQIVEKASGKRYPQFLKANIFRPLGMKETRVSDESRPPIKNRATSYAREGNGYKNADYHPLNWIYGDGNVNTTLRDMYKWDQGLYTEKLVKVSTLQEAWTSGKLNNGSETGYGFGWAVGNYLGLRNTSHSGGWAGFRTHISRFPEQRFTVIVLSNLAGFNPRRISNKIAKIYLGDKMTFPAPAKVSSEAMQEYAGRYQMAPDFILEIKFEDSALWAKFGDQEKDRLVPESVAKFYLEDMEDSRIEFNKDAAGKVTSATVGLGGRMSAPRLEP